MNEQSQEPEIIINGHTLTQAEATTVKMAIGTLMCELFGRQTQDMLVGYDEHWSVTRDNLVTTCNSVFIKMKCPNEKPIA